MQPAYVDLALEKHGDLVGSLGSGKRGSARLGTRQPLRARSFSLVAGNMTLGIGRCSIANWEPATEMVSRQKAKEGI